MGDNTALDLFIKSDNMIINEEYDLVDSLESSEYDDPMDISSSNSLSSIDQDFRFTTYQELYHYIEHNSTFDGTYYNYDMKKENHIVTFRMRELRNIVDTIMHYHTKYPVQNN